jgi:hypothetical protein
VEITLLHLLFGKISSSSAEPHKRDQRCIEILVGKSYGKRPLERPGRRWEDNIKMVLLELDWEGVN